MASETSKESVEITERDIVFDCPHCNGELVVDRDGAGMTFDCSHCGKSVTVPQVSATRAATARPTEEAVAAESKHEEPPKAKEEPKDKEAAPSEPAAPKTFDFSTTPREQVEKRLNELKLQYKENSSQRTEIRGYINRAQIELHRYQLRLQKLVDRQADMEAEIRAAQSFLGPPQG